MTVEMIYYDWTPDSMLEVLLPEPDNFLKIRETLTRIGIASRKEQKLYQSCHILHKQGRYYLVHFKELFLLDGKSSDFSEDDMGRRNTIANLIAEWNLVKLKDPEKSKAPVAPIGWIKIITHKDKGEWELVAKYNIGRKTRQEKSE